MEEFNFKSGMLNEGIRVQEVRICLLCKTEGTPMYEKMRDRLFDAPGVWNFLRCPHCGLVWLNPRPIIEDIGKIYNIYYAHRSNNPNPPKFLLPSLRKKIREAILATTFGYTSLLSSRSTQKLGKILGLISPLRDLVGSSVMNLHYKQKGKLLDVGCGDGKFLAWMRDLEWEVMGVDPDPEAVRVAQKQRGLDVYQGTLEEAEFPEESFDVITLGHVIEHLPDPVTTFKECKRVLRKGGVLVVVTPNIESLGHRWFGAAWMPLDPPRHFFIFSMQTMRVLAELIGFSIKELRTTEKEARDSWYFSRSLLKHDSNVPFSIREYLTGRVRLEGHFFWILEHLLIGARRPWGEEIVMIANK